MTLGDGIPKQTGAESLLPLLDRDHTFIAVIIGLEMRAGIGRDKSKESCGLGSIKTSRIKLRP